MTTEISRNLAAENAARDVSTMAEAIDQNKTTDMMSAGVTSKQTVEPFLSAGRTDEHLQSQLLQPIYRREGFKRTTPLTRADSKHMKTPQESSPRNDLDILKRESEMGPIEMPQTTPNFSFNKTKLSSVT